MRICHVWDADYPWDVRVEKISASLTEAGHDVHLVARNRRHEAEVERLPEATVHRLAPWRMAGRRVSAASMFPAFFNPRWYNLIDRVVRTTGSQVILVRDLPLAPTAIAVGRRRRIPVVMDMAENYPAMLQELWDCNVQRPLDVLVRNPKAARALESWSFPRLDHIVVVADESAERLRALGVPAQKMSVVENTPPRSRIVNRTFEMKRNRSRAGRTLKVVYLGLLEAPRGVESLLRAIAHLKLSEPDFAVHLDVVGEGRQGVQFREMAATLGLGDDLVTFHGFLQHDRAIEVVESCDVGSIPHLDSANWRTTMPNKLYDYMAGGLAVLATDIKPVDRVVRDTGSGLTYAAGSADDCARSLLAMRDPESIRAFGLAGIEAVKRRYHWEYDARTLNAALCSTID